MASMSAVSTTTRLGLFWIPLVICLLAFGCRTRDVPTIWKQEIRSPDGAWLAVAHTEQDGGFGSSLIVTSVDLVRVDKTINAGKPTNILEFDCSGPAKHAYVMDEANAGGTIGLTVRWLTPSHLEASYNGNANLLFQVAKMNDVHISVRDLSQEASPRTPSDR